MKKIIRLILFKKHGYILSDTQFFSALIEGCENEARQRGYELLISQVIHGEHSKEEISQIINQSKIDGILLLATEMNEADFLNFDNMDIPMVVLDSYFNNKSYDYIVINNLSGSYGATKYFIDKGHTRIGFLGSSKGINNFEYRYRGFIRAINDFKLSFKEERKVLVEPTLDGAYRDMKKYLKKHKENLPTAYFAFNDIIAIGAIRAMQESGINIPKQVSIVGFDDMPFCEISNPRLTTIRVYTQCIGKTAVRRLIQKIEDQDEINLKIEVNTKLIERESVKNISETKESVK